MVQYPEPADNAHRDQHLEMCSRCYGGSLRDRVRTHKNNTG